MRKLILTAAVVAAAIVGAFADETAFGTFTDTRDGQTYKTLKIGWRTWMAQNLNYRTDSSWCYDNNTDNCDKYGRLYRWDAAMAVCPAGWRLPKDAEWVAFKKVIGDSSKVFDTSSTASKKLKSTSGWISRRDGTSGNGTDDYGFSALPGGNRFVDARNINVFYGVNRYGFWWSTRESKDSTYAWHVSMNYFTGNVNRSETRKTDALSVRCVADSP
jgi:uncharacterized protein (TIGR02145 family)